MKQKEIAEALSVTAGAVSQWIKRGLEHGREALRGRIAKGGAPQLDSEQVAQLPSLLDQGAEVYGFRGKAWTAERVARLIKKQFGVSYHPAHCSRLLQKIRYSVQKTEEKATQRDEQAIETWKTEQWPALKKSGNRRQNHHFYR